MFILVFVFTFVISLIVMHFAKHHFVPVVVFIAVAWAMYGPWHWAHLLHRLF